MTLEDIIQADIQYAEDSVRRMIQEARRMNAGMRSVLSRAEIDGVSPEVQAMLARNVRENNHIEALGLRALCGIPDLDNRWERLVEFFETVCALSGGPVATGVWLQH